MEPTEIEEFTKEVQEGGESSMRDVSLVISVLAVLVAMVTVMGHREHTEAVLLQARSSDQWSEYQARKDRVQQLSIASDLLTLQPSSDSTTVQNKLAQYKMISAKWQKEIDQDQDAAKEDEAEVKVAEQKASRFDLGEALLQISVVLASITLLTRHRRYAIVAVVLGLAGALTAASAFVVHH